jgi:class 3 adenylate cyclase
MDNGLMPEDAPGQEVTILVVEDDSNMQVLTALQLKEQGYQAVVKSDGSSALVWLEQNKADLVILDLMLPGMSGLEVCSRIRDTHPPSVLPVLMVSALGNRAEDRVRGLQAGANDFIGKPYDEAELLARVNVLLSVKGDTERLEEQLSPYLASAIRTQAKLNPDVLKQRVHRHAVVLFADLRGFTHAAAHTQTGNMIDLLNEFFSAMMQVVDHHGGVVFDLIGDELLAAFNVPNDTPFFPSDLAVRAAIEMQELFVELQAKWAGRSSEINVGLGIGIHQGDVMLGNIGGAGLMRYTIMGDVVNIAHRLVDLAEEGEIIISSEVRSDISPLPDTIKVGMVLGVQLKGIDESQLVYKLSRIP